MPMLDLPRESPSLSLSTTDTHTHPLTHTHTTFIFHTLMALCAPTLSIKNTSLSLSLSLSLSFYQKHSLPFPLGIKAELCMRRKREMYTMTSLFTCKKRKVGEKPINWWSKNRRPKQRCQTEMLSRSHKTNFGSKKTQITAILLF
jgi:hypothetical protein